PGVSQCMVVLVVVVKREEKGNGDVTSEETQGVGLLQEHTEIIVVFLWVAGQDSAKGTRASKSQSPMSKGRSLRPYDLGEDKPKRSRGEEVLLATNKSSIVIVRRLAGRPIATICFH
ncbi:hypothetical protein Pcinc_042147, partial [Petrolisthes cinctipes]